MKKSIIIILIIIILVIVFAYIFQKSNVVNQISSQDDDQTVCTQDVKECPDGSFVSRMGLSCDFALCPDDVSNRYMIDDLGYEIEKRTTSKKQNIIHITLIIFK